MSDSKLLAENTIRRFMKLANTDTLSDNFVTEMYGKPPAKKDEEEKVEETVAEEETLEEAEEELEEAIEDLEETTEDLEEQEEDELDLDDELGAEEPEMDMDAEPEMDMDAAPETAEADMALSEEEAQLLIDLGQRLAAAIGGSADEPEMPAEEPEMDLDEPAAEEPEMDEEDEDMMQEDLVNEVLKRVTKRLVAEKLKNRK